MKDNVVHWLSKTESHLWESHLCQLLRNWKNKPWSKLKRLWCGSLNARRMLGRPCLKSSKAQPLRWSRATWKTKRLSWSTCKARWKRSKSLAWVIFTRWEPYLQTWANVFWLYTLKFHPHIRFLCLCFQNSFLVGPSLFMVRLHRVPGDHSWIECHGLNICISCQRKYLSSHCKLESSWNTSTIIYLVFYSILCPILCWSFLLKSFCFGCFWLWLYHWQCV